MTTTRYSRQHQAAERVYMRRWLRGRGIAPVMGTEPFHAELLMKQVIKAGGNPHELMKSARLNVDATRAVRHSDAANQRLKDAIPALCHEWFVAQVRQPYAALHLYFRRSQGATPGEVRIAEDKPAPDWELADPRRIGPACTKEQAEIFIRSVYGRLPILPTE